MEYVSLKLSGWRGDNNLKGIIMESVSPKRFWVELKVKVKLLLKRVAHIIFFTFIID